MPDSILLKNATLVDCDSEKRGDILLQNRRIAAIGESLPGFANKVIDAYGRVVMPAFVDLHAHFRDPGLTHKEDIESGCRAAVHGGYTTVNLMPNTKPVCSTPDVVRYVRNKAAKLGLCDVYQTMSITKDFDGKTLDHLSNLDSSVKWLTDDGFGVDRTAVILKAMEFARSKGVGLMLHEEDSALTGASSYLAEEIMTSRDVQLALLTGCRVHFCHVSTIKSMGYIVAGKARGGVNLTCEVTPHHLMLNDETKDNVNPPLRGEDHRKFLIDCIANGFVDAIATDHAPHTAGEKAEGANGFTGLDIAFATCYTTLVKKDGRVSLSHLSRLMSLRPAEILGLTNKGRLKTGMAADIVLVNPAAPVTVTADFLHSRGKNTPLMGQTLYGEILMTIKEGMIVYAKNH